MIKLRQEQITRLEIEEVMKCRLDQTLTMKQPMNIVKIIIRATAFSLLLLLATPGRAQLTFSTNNGTLTVTGYIGQDDAIIIPAEAGGIPVTSIGDSAFAAKTNLKSIKMQSSITTIGVGAFAECSALISIEISTNVTTIGNYAFDRCTSLSNINIPGSVTNLGTAPFSYCLNLTSIDVAPSNRFYTGLAGVLFDKPLTTLLKYPPGKPTPNYDLPASVQTLSCYAFEGCTNLFSLSLPEGLTTILDWAFSQSSLTNADLPTTVSQIQNTAFAYCSKLLAINIHPLNPYFSSRDGVLFNNAQTTLLRCPPGKVGPYMVPDGVETIPVYAFDACRNLTSIHIPPTTASISSYAFVNCASMQQISVDPLNERFSSAEGVLFNRPWTALLQYPPARPGPHYTTPPSVFLIGDQAFASCATLTSITIAEPITTIGGAAFQGCYNLTNVSLPKTLETIGQLAFNSCAALQSITIPDSVTYLGSGALSGCRTLSSLTLSRSLTSLPAFLCEGCTSLLDVTVPSTVASIEYRAFAYCTQISAVYFLGDAPGVDQFAFGLASNAIAYHLPGTAGWDSTYASLPTAPWVLSNPIILSSGAAFGIHPNGFTFIVSWATNASIVIEACTNITNPFWLPLQTNSLSEGSANFNDLNRANYPARFYRVRAQ